MPSLSGQRYERALERHARDEFDGRVEGGDRLRRRLHPGRVQGVTDQIGVGDDERMQRQRVGHGAADPLVARGWFDEPRQRSPCLGHDVGERRVPDVEFPQRGPRRRPGRSLTVRRQPGDELTRLRTLERDRATGGIDHVDRAEQAHEQPCGGVR